MAARLHGRTRIRDLVAASATRCPTSRSRPTSSSDFPDEIDRRLRRPRSTCSRICASIRRTSTSTRPARSPRAATWDDSVPDDEKSRRLSQVIALQERIAAERNRAWIGRTVEVLVEGPARRPPGHVAGKTPQFATAVVNADAGARKPRHRHRRRRDRPHDDRGRRRDQRRRSTSPAESADRVQEPEQQRVEARGVLVEERVPALLSRPRAVTRRCGG